MALPTDEEELAAISGPRMGPCENYAAWGDVTACWSSPADLGAEAQALVLEVASGLVWQLTGGRYSGRCTQTWSPCNPGCGLDDCRCPRPAKLDLGSVPVWAAEVTVDGDDVPIVVEDWRFVVRTDGLAWPTCATDWSLTIITGWPVPAPLVMATAILAREMAKQCLGLPCGLAPGTKSYTREGFSVEIADVGEFADKGLTGLPEVDRLLAPFRGARAGLFDPSGHHAPRRTTWAP